MKDETFAFERLSSGGLAGLQQTTYELARLFSLVTGETPPRRPRETRKGGTETIKHPRYQKFVSDFVLSTMTAGGKLHNNPWGQSSSLADALMIPVPYLPAGFDPKFLSLATLQRFLRPEQAARLLKLISKCDPKAFITRLR